MTSSAKQSAKSLLDPNYQFTAEVADAPTIAGEGKPRRNVYFPELVKGFDGIDNLHSNFLSGVDKNGDGPFLGTRTITDGVAGAYTWQTYSQVYRRVKNIGAYMCSIDGLKENDNIGLFSINRAEWVIAEQGCYMYGFVTVPLYDTLGPEAIEFISNQSKLQLIVCTSDKAKTLVTIKDKLPDLKSLIVMDSVSDELKSSAEAAGLKIISFADAETAGQESPKDARPMPGDGVCTICYTSGTTGLPKGVILTHKNVLAAAGAGMALMNGGRMYAFDKEDSHISYLPLAHVFERVVQVMVTNAGAACGFYQGDTLKLLDDVAELKPTIFCSVPRLYNRIYDKVLAGVSAKGGVSKMLFDKAFASKKRGLSTGTNKHWLWDKLIFGAVRAKLGGNVRIMITGAAPISAEVIDFLRICFSVDLYEGYGQTETSAGLSITDMFDLESGHVGAPFPCCEVKLVDVPEMNYTSADTPFPRGEVCVRGNNVFKGYYLNEEKTAETIDKDGFCHTGDIGMWDAKGRLKIVDRVKNIFKLAQGEYIAPEKIENVYGRHELVAQAFVYGDSIQSTLVGIIVPSEDTLPAWAEREGFGTKTLEEYCKDKALVDAFFKSISEFGKTTELKGFECLKRIGLHHEPFSMDNNLLTPTFKLKRHEAKKLFQAEIDEMYKSLSG